MAKHMVKVKRSSRAEEKAKLELMQSFFDSSPAVLGVIETTEDNMFHLYGNKASAQANGRTVEEVTNRWITDIGVPREAVPVYLEQYNAAKKNGQPITFENCYEMNGNTYWTSNTIRYMGIGNEGRDRYSYTILDVTKMKLAEIALSKSEERLVALNANLENRILEETAKLRESEASFRALAAELMQSKTQLQTVIDNAPILMWATDAEGTFTMSEGKALASIGVKGTDRLGRSIYDISRDSPEVLIAMQEALKGRSTNINIQRNGLWFDTFIIPILDDQQLTTSVIGMSIDISDRIKADQDRADFLAREQGAIESSRLKSEFLANMSHEIRTPINGMLGMTGLLLDSGLNEQQFEYADAARRSGEGLLTIINDILDFSKIEAGKLDFEEVEFNLAEVFQDVVQTMRFEAQRKDIRLTKDLASDLPEFVYGDPGRFRQILNNLISNAIKFTPSGVVAVNASVDPSRRDCLRVEIVDTGMGIDETQLAKLFTAFSQADSSTARRFGGTGLGLSICKKLVENMHGQIGVKSTLNQGSTFWFTVSMKFSKSRAVVTQLEKNATVNDDSISGRILVADDNRINQVVVSKMLEKYGFRVDVVGNGKEALEALLNIPYDLVLMDCQMPEMDGFEATSRIRNNGNYPSMIPIIALTANAMKGDADLCRAAGMDDYLSKPVIPENLVFVVRSWIKAARNSEPDKMSKLVSRVSVG